MPGGVTVPRDWSKLSKRERTQVLMLVSHLQEYAAGFEAGNAANKTAHDAAPICRFFSAAIHQYLHALFRLTGDQGAFSVLRAIGRPEVIDTITNVLETPIGTTTLGQIIDGWRDKAIAHPDFTFDRLKKAVFQHLPSLGPETFDAYKKAMHQLHVHTMALLTLLDQSYPGVVKRVDDLWRSTLSDSQS